MGKLISEKYAAPQHKSNLRNIRGTFAAEGMTISKSTRESGWFSMALYGSLCASLQATSFLKRA